MWAPLKKVLVRRPGPAFGSADPVSWHYTGQPDLDLARVEHDGLTDLLRQAGAEVVDHDAELSTHADSIYVFDPVLITNAGAVVLRMGKPGRRGEESALEERLRRLRIPVLGRIHTPGQVEGGDLLWLDDRTLAIGIGFRTNQEGSDQLTSMLAPLQVETLPVHLPCWQGREACLHLLSLISLLDRDLAVVHPPLIPVPLWQALESRGVQTIAVAETEFATMAPNVLALGPRHCIALAGNPQTRSRLEAAGCRVAVYSGQEISLKAEGGPTCLTQPIWRSL